MDSDERAAMEELLRMTEKALRLADRLGLVDPARHFDAARIAISRAIDPASKAGTLDDDDYLLGM